MHSLVTRVLVAAGAVLVVFLALTAFSLDVAFRNAAEGAIQERLNVQALALISVAGLDADGRIDLDEPLPEPRLQTPGSGLYAEVLRADGTAEWRSPSAVGVDLAPPPGLSAGERVFRRVATRDGEELFQFGLTVRWDDPDAEHAPRLVHFTVGEILAPYRAQLAGYRASLFRWFGLVFAGLIAAQLVILRRMLRPLRTLAAEVAEVESGSRDAVGGAYPRELQRLASNLNALIRNERGHLNRYRNTLGDLAHGLKTPLAVVRCALEEPAGPARDATIAEQVERMNEIVRFQLQRSLAAGSETFGRAVPVRAELDAVVASLAKVYADKHLRFDVDAAPDVTFVGDRGALLELAGNLLDNACKWAASQVAVRAEAVGDRLRLTVGDDGPGIPEHAHAAMLARGVRGDEHTAGHGIGLAVVNDLVSSRGGVLELGESPLGGLQVRVVL